MFIRKCVFFLFSADVFSVFFPVVLLSVVRLLARRLSIDQSFEKFRIVGSSDCFRRFRLCIVSRPSRG